MTEDYLNKLEFKEIKLKLEKHCKTYIAKEKARNLVPSFKKLQVESLLSETLEASNLCVRKSNLPSNEIADISIAIKSLQSGNSLSAKSLLEIANILKLAREFKEYFYKDEEFDISAFPKLDGYFSSLYSNPNIESKIFSSIIDEEIEEN